MPEGLKISVVGLGYVGLPLAVALARHWPVNGYDSDSDRIAALQEGRDRTGEVAAEALRAARDLTFADRPAAMAGSDLFVIAVPTPVDAGRRPDLSLVIAACEAVGGALARGATVVLESTVYPGVTERICGPVLERASGLRAGRDFRLGYSPERMNPGDAAHGLAALTKVVAGQDAETTELLAAVYGRITDGKVFVARDIRTAEAAKVIENAQRDVNIAFINEVAMIFDAMDLSTPDVLEAARTKWNFLDFRPGLVGGHCIGVDPYYLAAASEAAGHQPEIILAGRRINDGMAEFIAGRVIDQLDGPAAGARILVLGLAFKENVPDLRNSQSAGLVRLLREAGAVVEVHDSRAEPGEAKRLYGIDLMAGLDRAGPFDAVVGAVAHQEYRSLDAATLARLVRPGGLIADVKGLWRGVAMPGAIRYWAL